MRLTRLAVLIGAAAGLALSAEAAGPKVELLAGFEPPAGKGVAFDGEIVKAHATEGAHALKMTNTGKGFTSIDIADKALLRKFTDYVLFKVDVYNPTDGVIRYAMRVDDAKSKGYGSRYNDEHFVAPPGRSLLELNVTSLLRSGSKNFHARDKLDTSQLTLLKVFMLPSHPGTLYFDNVRLESSGLPAVAGLRAFDFGPAKSAVYPGFEGCNEKMPYAADRGFGWDKPQGRDRVYGPDDLAADFLHGGRFRLDLPNGRYEVNVCIDPFGAWHRYPTFAWRKLILNGRAVLDEKRTGAEFLDRFYFRHEDAEDLPGQDVWAKFVTSRNVIRRYDIEVADGKLTVAVDADDKHGRQCLFLVVYPADKRAAGRQWMAALDAVRKARFDRNLYVIVPKPANPVPRPSAADRARGFIPFVRHTEKDLTVRARPDAAERTEPLAMAAAAGEREHLQIGLYPLAETKNVAVTVSNLTHPNGAVIPASAVRVRKVRNFLKHMGRARAGTILPYILLDFDRLDLTPGVTRGVWLTVKVPPAAAAGAYSGSVTVAGGGKSASLPMTVTVYPFELAKARSITLSVTGFTAGHWKDWHGDLSERWWKTAEAAFADLADHGMNAVTGGPGAVLTGVKDGKAVIDYADMDRWMALAVKHGLTHPGDSYQGLTVRGIPRDSRDLKANQRIAQSKYGVSYPELIRIAFADLQAHAKRNHWPPRVHYLLDEPRPEWGNVESALEMTKIWLKAAPGVMFSGYYSLGQGRDPYFQVMPVSISHFKTQALELTKQAGKQLWDYDGNRARHNIGRWAFAASRAGLAGYLRNGYMYVNSDPYFDFSDDEASWCVVYPSRRDTVNATVGWERTGEGVDDFRYLEMLDRLVKQARRAGKAGAAADAAEAYLTRTLAPIDLEKRSSADLAPAAFDAFKADLARHIIALTKALGG